MKAKPKILFVTPLPPPVHGSSMVSNIIRESALINETFEVDFVNLSTSRSMAEIGKKSYSLYARKALRFIGSYAQLLWKLITKRYDLTYLAITVHDVGFLKDCPFVLAARLLSKHHVIHQHNRGMAPYVHRAPWKWLLPMAYKNARVILLSQRLYPDISEVVSEEQVMVCPNGLQPADTVDATRKSYSTARPEILFLSNLVESKGVWVLLDALKMLKEKGIDFHCTLVGGTSRFISAEIFNAKVNQLDLSDVVEYVGPKYGDDKWKAYDRADVFVLPSMDDTLPLTILEAMMCGVPVVSTDIGAIPDLVEHGVNGFIVSSEDLIVETGGKFLDWEPTTEMAARITAGDTVKTGTRAVAECLEKLLTDASLREKMGRAGHDRYQKHFTKDVFETRMCECLKQAINGIKRQTTCLIAFLLAITLQAANISIRTQSEFDVLGAMIERSINQGEKDIIIDIQTDRLTFSEQQINLRGINASDVSILIRGNGVHLTSTGRYVNRLSHPDRMYLLNGGYYNPWTEFQSASDTIRILDADRHQCHIPTLSRNTKNRYPKDCYVQYTCWYTSQISPITAIGKRSISFDGGEWAVTRIGNFCNVNMDYAYARTTPRYRLFGTKRLPKRLYECSASTLLQLESCLFRSFTLKDIHAVGSNADNPLIFVKSCQADSICVTSSDFSCIGGTLLLVRNSSNVCFTDNHVDHAMGIAVRDEYGCSGTRVTGNVFSNCGFSMSNTMVILLNGEHFTVSRNVLSDFCYGGIGVGIWGGSSTQAKCSGTVSDNELFYTRRFLSALDQNTLMDSGAIYVWTRTDGISITGNYIHDIAGMKDNRGIFCDDGTKNVTITGNRIERIANSYDIDLRLCDGYKNQVPDYNTGNYIHGNQTTGKVRFEQK